MLHAADELPRSNFATMRFNPESLHGANNGLNIARDLMENVKKDFNWISYGDLWTLGGVAAVQVGLLHNTDSGRNTDRFPFVGNGRTQNSVARRESGRGRY